MLPPLEKAIQKAFGVRKTGGEDAGRETDISIPQWLDFYLFSTVCGTTEVVPLQGMSAGNVANPLPKERSFSLHTKTISDFSCNLSQIAIYISHIAMEVRPESSTIAASPPTSPRKSSNRWP